MSSKLCKWKDNVWLGLTSGDLDSFCGKGEQGIPTLDEKYMDSTTVWIAWLDNYMNEPEAAGLKALYERLRKERVIDSCGEVDKSIKNRTWENLIVKILENMKDIAKIKSSDEGLRGGEGKNQGQEGYRWRDILKRKICPTTDKSKMWMGAISCLIHIWEGKIPGTEDKYRRLPDECEGILRKMKVRESDWQNRVNANCHSSEDYRKSNSGLATPTPEDEGKVSLILSLYGSLTTLCTTCGPYDLSNWLGAQTQASSFPSSLYCALRGDELECKDSPEQLKGRGRYILYRTRSKLRFASGPTSPCLMSSQRTPQKASTSQHSPGPKNQENVGESLKFPPIISSLPQEAQNEHVPQTLSGLSRTGATELKDTGQSNLQGPKGEDIEGHQPQGKVSAPNPPNEGHQGPDGSGGATSSRVSPPKGQKHKPPPSEVLRKQTVPEANSSEGVIGGIITSIILGALAVYGAWRIRKGAQDSPPVGTLAQRIMVGYLTLEESV
ncbi:hypothetical protein C922_05326 [Plasmodium inui San Antonio 1]|uniref:Uncharacterized protein n=1 Tax=Plasmodium inui San Antonio 1 TaxID=1237626 RepID=W7A5C3_9APIC|nr:hypothetical protein C922_05326 [Plasmodium inui San Antonio 1]EUD64294.1 hypothetical protein C922_05326 [Plasmodium inui San Antonio 1]